MYVHFIFGDLTKKLKISHISNQANQLAQKNGKTKDLNQGEAGLVISIFLMIMFWFVIWFAYASWFCWIIYRFFLIVCRGLTLESQCLLPNILKGSFSMKCILNCSAHQGTESISSRWFVRSPTGKLHKTLTEPNLPSSSNSFEIGFLWNPTILKLFLEDCLPNHN